MYGCVAWWEGGPALLIILLDGLARADRQLSQWPKVGLVACHVIISRPFFSPGSALTNDRRTCSFEIHSHCAAIISRGHWCRSQHQITNISSSILLNAWLHTMRHPRVPSDVRHEGLSTSLALPLAATTQHAPATRILYTHMQSEAANCPH
jgi:hypothetical protein